MYYFYIKHEFSSSDSLPPSPGEEWYGSRGSPSHDRNPAHSLFIGIYVHLSSLLNVSWPLRTTDLRFTCTCTVECKRVSGHFVWDRHGFVANSLVRDNMAEVGLIDDKITLHHIHVHAAWHQQVNVITYYIHQPFQWWYITSTLLTLILPPSYVLSSNHHMMQCLGIIMVGLSPSQFWDKWWENKWSGLFDESFSSKGSVFSFVELSHKP